MTYALDLDGSSDRWSAGRYAGPDPSFPADAVWRARLRTVLTERVVPRLLAREQRHRDPAFTAERVAAFAALLLGSVLGAASGAVEDALADGAPLDMVFLQLFGPAACHLGDLWLADRLSFLDVTRGSMALQALLRMFAPSFEGLCGGAAVDRSILLMPVPGEQHVLGLSMLAMFFRRAGWRVAFEPGAGEQALARLATERFDVVGVSVAGSKCAARLPAFVQRLRDAAVDAAIPILAGGAAFAADPTLHAASGVDAVSLDAPAAVAMAESLAGARSRMV